MKTFTAHVSDRAAPVLVPEAFSLAAAVFGPFWLLAHRAWIPAVLSLCASVMLATLPDPTQTITGLAFAAAHGIFGRDLVRWSLERRGFVLAHVVAARDEDAAYARLLAARPDLAGETFGVKVAVIDYGSGNLASAARALALAAERSAIAATVTISSDPDFVAGADRIVLPGQGAFADCAQGLAGIDGLREAVLARADAGHPFLGICVGMQLMAERGLEHAITPGFGWIKGDIAEMAVPASFRLPQMGWNELVFTPGIHPLLDGIEPGDHAYFVHSYALTHGDPAQTIATTDYGGPVCAIVATGNRAGTQFHVEKSQEVGLRILANFLRWTP